MIRNGWKRERNGASQFLSTCLFLLLLVRRKASYPTHAPSHKKHSLSPSLPLLSLSFFSIQTLLFSPLSQNISKTNYLTKTVCDFPTSYPHKTVCIVSFWNYGEEITVANTSKLVNMVSDLDSFNK